MLEFKQTIEEKAYNDMRELVGWRRLDPQPVSYTHLFFSADRCIFI